MRWSLLVLAIAACPAARTTNLSASVTLRAGELAVVLPPLASEPVRIQRSEGAYLELEAIGVDNAPARIIDSKTVVYERSGMRITHLAANGRIEELRHVERTAGPLAYRVKLGPALSQLRVVEDIVEALDGRGVALLRTEPAYLLDARGVRRDLHPAVSQDGEAWSLTWSLDDRGLTYPLDIDPAWTVTTSLAQPRRNNSLHLLSSGRVVTLAGLSPGNKSLSSAEIWDPTTKSWTAAGALQRPRAYSTACSLPSGKILAAGGLASDVKATAEIYDPTTMISTLIAAPAPGDIGTFARCVAISTSQVLIAGDSGGYLLDVATGAWTDAPYVVPRDYPTITLLASGRVLLAGGAPPGSFSGIADAESFDPSTKKWARVASMKVKRMRPEAVTLLTGKALFAGGANGESSAELYDPIADTWTITPSMTSAHSFNSMVLLSNGRVLNVGGDVAAGLTDVADLYDPVANTWSLAGKLSAPLDDFGMVALSGGRALVAGGSNGTPVGTTQLFEPGLNGRACLGNGECTSGFCVDGACCEKSACAAGETCGGAGAPGACLKRDSSSCAKNSDCGSGHCVDSVCCESACTGVCADCNLKGAEGRCVAVPAGDAPHGSRGDCPGVDPCRARCGGVDRAQCTQFPGTPILCASPKCEAGKESLARGCDGAGACATGLTRPCGVYGCGATACKTQCDADGDCVEGNTCDLVSRKCVIAATCEGEQFVRSPEGKARSCTPFRCEAGRCLETCKDSSACAGGFICDVASSRCAPAALPEDAAGGCAHSRPAPSAHWFAMIAFLLGARRARRVAPSASRRP